MLSKGAPYVLLIFAIVGMLALFAFAAKVSSPKKLVKKLGPEPKVRKRAKNDHALARPSAA